MQVRAALKGHSLKTSAYTYVSEYFARERLAKLGYVSSFSSLDAHKADIFAIISVEVDKAQADEARAKSGRK